MKKIKIPICFQYKTNYFCPREKILDTIIICDEPEKAKIDIKCQYLNEVKYQEVGE